MTVTNEKGSSVAICIYLSLMPMTAISPPGLPEKNIF